MPRGVRKDEVRTERRRRDHGNLDRIHNLKLALPSEFRGDDQHEYRWINDDNDRVYSLTVEDDWDVCATSKAGVAETDDVRRQVGVKKNGEPLYAFLVRKRRDWYLEDKRSAATANTAREDALLKRPETDTPQAGATQYVASGNSIKRRGAYAP